MIPESYEDFGLPSIWSIIFFASIKYLVCVRKSVSVNNDRHETLLRFEFAVLHFGRNRYLSAFPLKPFSA